VVPRPGTPRDVRGVRLTFEARDENGFRALRRLVFYFPSFWWMAEQIKYD
jgi:hypothetical protein